MSDAIGDRIENLAEAVRAQGRVLGMMLGHQKLHNDMLAKVLEAVTKTHADDDDDDGLGGLLNRLVEQSKDHGEKLALIFERVYSE